MGNLGLTEAGQLHLIAPRCDWTSSQVLHEAYQGAAHAGDLLRAATVHESFEAFLQARGHGVRVAFSGREGTGRRIREFSELLSRDLHGPSDLSLALADAATPLQLHFGTEDDGLSLAELEPMNFICRLPSSPQVPSYNLSHAVLMALYILMRETQQLETLLADATLKPQIPVESQPLEYPRAAIRQWLEVLGFDLGSRRISIETSLNRILLSHCPSKEDVRLLEKVLFQTVEKLRTAKETV